MEEGNQQRKQEEKLLGTSATGDLETVIHLLQSGVDPNCKNKVRPRCYACITASTVLYMHY